MNETKRLVAIALIVGLSTFIAEEVVCTYLAFNYPRVYAWYFDAVTLKFNTHGVTVTSQLWLLILVYAIIKPEKSTPARSV